MIAIKKHDKNHLYIKSTEVRSYINQRKDKPHPYFKFILRIFLLRFYSIATTFLSVYKKLGHCNKNEFPKDDSSFFLPFENFSDIKEP